MSIRSRRVTFATAAVAALLLLVVGAPPSRAAGSPTFVRSWAATAPAGIITDANGSVFVTEPANQRIVEFDPAGNILSTRTGLTNPAALGIDGAGTLYVLDGGSVNRFDAAGSSLGGWATGVNTPTDLAVDAAGNVFVLSSQPTGPSRLVSRFSSSGTLVTSWSVRLETRAVAVLPDGSKVLTINRHTEFGNTYTEILSTNASGGSAGDFNFSNQVGIPIGLSAVADGTVFATDTSNRITRFTANGAQDAQWGTSGPADGQFNTPRDVAAGFGDRLYIADRDNNRVQAFTSTLVTTCRGEDATVYLTEGDSPTAGDDVIIGTSGSETVDALGGDDTVCALSGDDTVLGGTGNDDLDGGTGADNLSGGDDVDHLYGGIGPDELQGGEGPDVSSGGPGRDRLFGGPKNDGLFGGLGDDALAGNEGDDLCAGGDGTDRAGPSCEFNRSVP